MIVKDLYLVPSFKATIFRQDNDTMSVVVDPADFFAALNRELQNSLNRLPAAERREILSKGQDVKLRCRMGELTVLLPSASQPPLGLVAQEPQPSS